MTSAPRTRHHSRTEPFPWRRIPIGNRLPRPPPPSVDVAVKPHFSSTGQYIDRHTVTMDAQIFPASPDATREFLDARRAVFRAIALDHKSGVSANRIADMVSGAISRPVVLAYLTAEQ